MIENINVAAIKDEIARELNDPRSPWKPSELMGRLIELENAVKFLEFQGFFAGFSGISEENSHESS